MRIIKDAISELYNGNHYWVGLLAATILIVTAPVVVPTRIIYRTFKAIKSYGL